MSVSTRTGKGADMSPHDSADVPADAELEQVVPNAVASDGAESGAPERDEEADADASGGDDDVEVLEGAQVRHRVERPRRPGRIIAFWILPIVAMVLAAGAGYLKYQDGSQSSLWRAQSVQAAKDGTVAILSYRPDTVDQVLAEAQSRLTGDFRDSYASLTHDVVIPGAKERQISALASVPAAASVAATERDAVVLVFVNQSTVIGAGAPTDSASTVKVTLEKSGDDWLIAGFDPI